MIDGKKYPKMLVEWLDSGRGTDWADIASHSGAAPCFCVSVGFVLSETTDAIVLVQSVDEANQTACASITIPKACIKTSESLYMMGERGKL